MYKEDWSLWPEFNPPSSTDLQGPSQSQRALANEDNPFSTNPAATVDPPLPRDTGRTAEIGVDDAKSQNLDVLPSRKANISKTFMSHGAGGGGAESQTDVEQLCQSIADRIVVVSEGTRGGIALRLPLTCVGRGSKVTGEDAEEEEWEEGLGSGARRRSIGFGDNGGVGTGGHEVEDVAKVTGVECILRNRALTRW